MQLVFQRTPPPRIIVPYDMARRSVDDNQLYFWDNPDTTGRQMEMIGWIRRKLLGLKTIEEIETPDLPDDLPEEEIIKLAYKDEYPPTGGRTCSYCDKRAIGYETHINCGACVCEEHASKITLKLPPGYRIDLLKGKPHSTTQKDGCSYGGYMYFGGHYCGFPITAIPGSEISSAQKEGERFNI